MSILIKGIEMPTSCSGCPTCRDVTTLDGDYWLMCGYNGKPLESEIAAGKPDWCPLIPVPPHGDLIDRREAIIDANERAYDFWLSDDEVSATIQFLKEQPTIIPAEEGE
jgi:hypothetical protein